MKKQSILGSLFIVAAVGTAFWAYTSIELLRRDYQRDLTVFDLGVLFVLGLVTGIAVGAIIGLQRKPHNATRPALSEGIAGRSGCKINRRRAEAKGVDVSNER
ncbi:MAG: hypothetical protein OEW18_02180 [Candidatus Aminicenantes bacterium]|nr:hypothetical protein [Candidatus Aminicenantes bacterium]